MRECVVALSRQNVHGQRDWDYRHGSVEWCGSCIQAHIHDLVQLLTVISTMSGDLLKGIDSCRMCGANSVMPISSIND